MKIGVLSDSHVTRRGSLPSFIWQTFAQVDLILHSGDIMEEEVLLDLKTLAPVEAVQGNMDRPSGFQHFFLPAQKILHVGGKKIGLIHGDGMVGTTPERARLAFKEDGVHCVVFGHSHQPMNQVVEGILMFNPGSCTQPRSAPHPSCGLLHIEGEEMRGEILYFEK